MAKPRSEWAAKILDTLEGWLYPDGTDRRRILPKSVKQDRREQETRSALWQKYINLSLIIFISVGFVTAVAGFVFAVNFYSNTFDRIANHKDVVNLTEAGLKAHISLAEDIDCNAEDPTCWLNAQFNDSQWASEILPKINLDKLPNHATLQKTGWAYYRIILPIPDRLIQLEDEISFSPMQINHPLYFVYLNGQLNRTGNGFGEALPNISIPKKLIKDNKVFLAIKGKMTESSIGIRHRGYIAVGPKVVLDGMAVGNERGRMTFFLLFILSKGSIFLVLSLFYFFSRHRTGLAYFLVFAFFTTIDNFYIGFFLKSLVSEDIRIVLIFTGQVIAFAALLAYFAEFFQTPVLKKAAAYFCAILLPLVTWLTIDLSWGYQIVEFDTFFGFVNSLFVAVVLTGFTAGILKIRNLGKIGAKTETTFNISLFTWLNLIYGVLLIWEVWFNEYKGFDLRALFDLGFFMFVAFLTAREFSTNERRIITFADHMREKVRMEQELQDAAQIAQAFIPEHTPQWSGFKVSSFHQALTETSGDWFSFVSQQDKLYHFIMCDVTGHGVQAALIVSACKTVLAVALKNQAQGAISRDFTTQYAHLLNEILYTQGKGFHTTTFVGLTFDLENNKLLYFAAAHPPPIIISPEGTEGAQSRLLLNRHGPLGAKPQIDAKLQEMSFGINDRLIAYSDGIPLAINRRLVNNLIEVSRSNNANAEVFVKAIQTFEHARNGFVIEDDTTLICFERVA